MVNSKPWFNSWPTQVPKHIEYPEIPLQEILQKSAKEFQQKTAIIFDEREISYAQLDLLSNQFANSLVKLGVKKGERVAIFLPNIPQFIVSYFGILKAGGVVTAISPLHREREVEYQLKDSGAQTIVALDSLYPIIEKVKQKTQLKNVILTGLNEYSYKKTSSPRCRPDFCFSSFAGKSPS